MAIYSSLIYLENIVIFHSYVNLPEANDWIGDVSITLLVGYFYQFITGRQHRKGRSVVSHVQPVAITGTKISGEAVVATVSPQFLSRWTNSHQLYHLVIYIT